MKKLLFLLLFLPTIVFGQQVTQQSKTPASGVNAGNQYLGYWGIAANGYFIPPYGANATLNRAADINGLFYVQLSDSSIRFRYNGNWIPLGKSSSSTATYFSSTYFAGLGTFASPLTIIPNSVFPSQTGQSGKFLTTNGLGTLSWATVSSGGVSTGINGLNGTTNIGLGGTLTQNTNIANSTFYLRQDSIFIGTRPTYTTPSGTIVFIGTSITVGTGSTGGTRYSTLVATGLGLTENNLGVSGSCVENQSPSNPAGGISFLANDVNVPTYSSLTGTRILVVEVGPNDFNVGYTNYNPTNFQTDLTTLINYFTSTKGWPAGQILILSNGWYLSTNYGTTGAGGLTLTQALYANFQTASHTVATNLGTRWFDLYNWMGNRGGNTIMYDVVHPNATGHAIMANGILSVLNPAVSYPQAYPLSVNGQAQVSNLKLNNQYQLVDGSNILGLNSTNDIGYITGLPTGTRTLGTFYTGGNVLDIGATLPASGLGTNDYLLRQNATIWGVYNGNNAYQNTIQMIDNGANMNFKLTYNNANFNFYVNNSATTALQISKTGTLYVNNAQTNVVSAANGDVWIPTQTGLKASPNGIVYGAFMPIGASNWMQLINTYSGTGISFIPSGGTNGSQQESMRIWPTGEVTIQKGGSFTSNTIAAFAINSTTQGFLPPSLTSTQIRSTGYVISLARTGGSGYTTAPTLTFSSPDIPGGTTATAICTVSGGAIATVTLTNSGTGYLSTPTVTVTPTSGGTGGAVTVTAISYAGNAGLIYYNSTYNKLNYFDGTAIRVIADSASTASSLPKGANPTATAGATAVNGSATTFMRSDAAPKVDSTVFQTVANFFPKGDTRYLKSSTVSGLANPTGTIGFTAVNGSATTGIRSDGAPKADSTVIRSVANSYSLSAMQTKLNGYVPTSRTVAGFALSSNVTLASLTNGYGITSLSYNASGSATVIADTTVLTSQSRLATNLTGYLKTTTATSTYVPYSGATGNVTLGTNSISAGTFTVGTLGYSDVNILGSFQSSVNTYNQLIIQNTNSGSAASADVVVNNNNSTASTYYGDFGMNSSGFTGSQVFNQPNYVFVTATTGDLALGTTTNNAIHFVVNNGTTDAMTISGGGTISIPAFSTAGLVHNAVTTGALSSSLAVQADVTNGYVDLSSAQASIAGNKGFTGLTTMTNTGNQLTLAYDGTHSTTLATNSAGTLIVSPTNTAVSFVADIYGINYYSRSNSNASYMNMTATGTIISQNIVGTNTALKVNQLQGTGDIQDWQFNSSNVATMGYNGKFTLNGSISASANLAQGINSNHTLTAIANNDVIVEGDFNPTIAGVGIISTLGSVTGGSSYTNGTYTNVPLTGGNGSGAQATVVVSGGAVSTVTITTAGTRYTVNDVLSAAAANIGGTGSGFSVPVATLTQTVTGAPLRATVTNIGQGSSANFNGSWADGLLLYNSTAAVSTLSQNSPVIHLSSFGWGSTGGTSQAVDAFIYSQANTGTVPNANLTFTFGVAGAKTTAAYTFGSGGAATFTSGSLTLTRSSQGATAFNSLIQQNTTAATSGTPNQWTPTWYNEGAVWNTSGTPASNSFAFGLIGEGTSSANPYSTLYFQTYLGTSTTPTFVNTMSLTTQGQLALGLANTNIQAGSQAGSIFNIGASTVTDASTASGTVTNFAVIGTGLTTLAATNSSITYTNGYGAFFTAPTSGTNVTMTNKYALGLAYDATHLFTVAVNSAGAATLNATSTVTITPATTITGALTLSSTVNKVTVTAPASAATLTLVTGSTLQTTGAFTLNLTTTANSTPTFPTGSGTLPYLSGTNTWTGVNTMILKNYQANSSPTAVNASATLTAAQVQSSITTSSTTAVAFTMPTATLLATQVGAAQGTVIFFTIDNSASTSSGAITLTLGSGMTSGLTAGLTVPIGKAQTYEIYFTSTTTCVMSQIL